MLPAEVADGPVATETNYRSATHFFSNQGYVIHVADQYDASFVKRSCGWTTTYQKA